jgi:hypothetical protein
MVVPMRSWTFAVPAILSMAAGLGSAKPARAMASLFMLGVMAPCDTPTEPTPPPAACTYIVAPTEFTPCMSAPGGIVFSITTSATCRWSAPATVPWLSPAAAIEGTGNGFVRYLISDNWDAPRAGLISVLGELPGQVSDVRVTQAGCRYWLSQTVMNIPASGGSFTFDVLQQTEPLTCGGPLQNACRWSALADSNWILITTPMPRTGDQPVSFTVAPNGTSAVRTGTIAVRDRVVQVSQAGQEVMSSEREQGSIARGMGLSVISPLVPHLSPAR